LDGGRAVGAPTALSGRSDANELSGSRWPPVRSNSRGWQRFAAVADRRCAGCIRTVAVIFDGTELAMVTTIALCALAAFTLSRVTLRAGRMVAYRRNRRKTSNGCAGVLRLHALTMGWNEFQICCVSYAAQFKQRRVAARGRRCLA
jgi:hypothetical protein